MPSLTGARCAIPGKPQNGSACSYMVAENVWDWNVQRHGAHVLCGLVDRSVPPTNKWLFNLGIRLDSFNFEGQNTTEPPLGGSAQARAFWFSAYNLDNCVDDTTGAPFPNPNPADRCPAGSHGAIILNAPSRQLPTTSGSPV